MDNILTLKQILENQKEIKYFGYFINIDERTKKIKLELSASGIVRKYNFSNVDNCLNKIIEILQELKRLENYYLSKA